MTYRLDDEGAFDRRRVGAGNEACGAVDRAGQWCAHELTDGIFPRDLAFSIAPPHVWERAALHKLIEILDESTYRIGDYLQWNWNADRVRAEREEAKSRMRRARSRGRSGEQTGERAGERTAFVQGTALGSGSESEGGAGGNPPSAARLKSVPPPPPEPPERARIRDAIAAEPKLSDLDADDLAGEALTAMVAKGFKLQWVLDAIRDAAAKSERGEQRHVRVGRVIGFIRRCKPKHDEQERPPPPAHREDDDRDAVERIRRMPKRVGPNIDLPADLLAAVGKIGTGGK